MLRNGTRILLTAMVGLLLAAAPAAAQKQVLHMAYWGGPSHQMVQTQQAWIKTVDLSTTRFSDTWHADRA